MFLRQRIIGEPRQHAARIADRAAQLADQLVPGNRTLLGKFQVALALEFRAAEVRDDPLADIPAQVQHKIACAVGRWIGTPPDLLFRKLLQGLHDEGKAKFREPFLRARQKHARRAGYFWFHGTHLASKS